MLFTKRIVALFVLLAGFGLSTACSATTFTVGNPVSGGSVLDTCNGCAYIIGQDFGGVGILSTYSFHAGQAGDITPLLITYTISGTNVTFTVAGIGTTQAIAGPGTYTFNYGPTAGIDVTSVGSAFGFYSNTPVVLFDYFNIATPPASGATYFIPSGPLTLGETSTSDIASGYHVDQLGVANNRTYAINATAVTPEPATLSLLALGITSLGAMGRFRRR
jgi:hypothetical protein